jgi:hypothetical protein
VGAPEFANTLLLYFNQLDAVTRGLLGVHGGRYVSCPVGWFYHTATQTLAAANTGYAVACNSTHFSDGVVVAATTQFTASYAGAFSIRYAGQVRSTSAAAKEVYFWLRRNGVAVGYSTKNFTVSGSGANLAVDFAFDIDLDAGDYAEIMWSSTDTAVELSATAAAAPHPGIAASMVSVNFVAPLPDPRPAAP